MKILLIDGEENILNLVKMNLMFENYEVIVAKCLKSAIKKVKNEIPDLVVLDINLSDIDGFKVLEDIQSINAQIPIIVLSSKNELNDKLLALELGADDYITKPFDSRELILRIRVILRRINKVKFMNEKEKSDKIVEKDFIKIVIPQRRIFIDSREVIFTHIEFEILSLMVQNSYKVFTREELLENIWGYDFSGNTRAVDIHIKRIRKKLLHHEQAIKTIYGVGYRFEV